MYPTPPRIPIKITNFCIVAWAVNFTIKPQNIMNIIRMHDFISHDYERTEENINSIHWN